MNFTSSLSLQLRITFALVMRRIRSRYIGSRAGYLWAFLEPIVWIFAIKMAINHGSARPPIGTSFEVFICTGLVIARFFRASAHQVSSTLLKPVKANVPSIQRLDTAYASWIIETLTGVIVLIVILAILYMFGHDAAPGNLLMCIIVYAIGSILAVTFGLSFGVLMILIPVIQHFRSVIMLIIFITSGFAMVIDRVPPEIRRILVWNPLLHVIEWFREAFYLGYECKSLSLTYLFGFIVATAFLGLIGERALRRRVRKPGGNYGEDDGM